MPKVNRFSRPERQWYLLAVSLIYRVPFTIGTRVRRKGTSCGVGQGEKPPCTDGEGWGRPVYLGPCLLTARLEVIDRRTS